MTDSLVSVPAESSFDTEISKQQSPVEEQDSKHLNEEDKEVGNQVVSDEQLREE